MPCSGFGEKEKWEAHKQFLQKWNHCRDKSLRVCDLTCMLQKAWALLRVVSAKGSAILGDFERRGHGWPQGFRRLLITLLWKDQRMDDRRYSTIVGGRKVFQVLCGCCCCFETESHESWAALQLSVEQNDLEPLILLPPLSMCWDFRSAPVSSVIVLRSLDPESSRVRWSSCPLTTRGSIAVAESYPLASKTGSPSILAERGLCNPHLSKSGYYSGGREKVANFQKAWTAPVGATVRFRKPGPLEERRREFPVKKTVGFNSDLGGGAAFGGASINVHYHVSWYSPGWISVRWHENEARYFHNLLWPTCIMNLSIQL